MTFRVSVQAVGVARPRAFDDLITSGAAAGYPKKAGREGGHDVPQNPSPGRVDSEAPYASPGGCHRQSGGGHSTDEASV